MWSRVRYRLWQFWQELRPRPLPSPALQEIAAILTPAELALFRRYSLSDQTHSYRVLALLRDHGETDPTLLAAALLHDIGKTRVNLTLWDRVWVVLGQPFFKGEVAADERPFGWRKAFVVKKRHAAWGAEMLATSGSDPKLVALVAHHQDKDVDGLPAADLLLLRRLQWADDQN